MSTGLGFRRHRVGCVLKFKSDHLNSVGFLDFLTYTEQEWGL